MRKVRACDGAWVTVFDEVIEHMMRKHPEMVSLAAMTRERMMALLLQALENPVEMFVDALGTKYFLTKAGDLYLNVIVANGMVKTAYLMGERTHTRMEKTRWLHRLY